MAMLNNQMVPISWGFSSTLRRTKNRRDSASNLATYSSWRCRCQIWNQKKSMYVYYSMHIYIYTSMEKPCICNHIYIYYVTFYGKAI